MSHENNESAVAIGCFLLTIILVLMLYIASPAKSQEAPQGPSGPPCAKSDAIDKQLEKEFGETITAAGVLQVQGQGYMYLTTNPKTGSFTVLVRRPDGVSCIVLGGKGFALADPAPQKGTKL